jgi:hypothetical protein
MHVLFFIEEPSTEAALANLIPKLLQEQITYQFIVFQGKHDLLNNLNSRLRGYANWSPEDWRYVVLIDEDRDDCMQLKNQMEEAAKSAGLTTKTQSKNGNFKVLNRIVIEELEAWFLGDIDALRQVFPRLPASLASRQKFRDPDAITGGTWETLERLLQTNGYYRSGYPKVLAAHLISLNMEPQRNRSHSFQIFYRGLQSL